MKMRLTFFLLALFISVAIITLNRPKAKNAINFALSTAIEKCVDRIESDDSIWCSVSLSSDVAQFLMHLLLATHRS